MSPPPKKTSSIDWLVVIGDGRSSHARLVVEVPVYCISNETQRHALDDIVAQDS